MIILASKSSKAELCFDAAGVHHGQFQTKKLKISNPQQKQCTKENPADMINKPPEVTGRHICLVPGTNKRPWA